MRSLVAERKPARGKRVTTKRPAAWWGEGGAPHLRWGAGVFPDLGAQWSAPRKRWETVGGDYFDAEAADFACGFFPTFLIHHIGEHNGRPFDLLDYQRVLVRAMFGWKRADGLRRFRKVFLAVPKGSGKSPLGSGLGLFFTAFDHEPGAEVYAVAADRAQARIVHDTAKIMVQKSEPLGELFEVYRDSIRLRGSVEYYQVLSSDSPTKHGFRPHAIIFDEFHAQATRDLYDTLDRGTVKRRQPMTMLITTAGDDDESICFEEWDYARRIISGGITDDTYLPMIFEAGAEEDWTDIEVVKRVNPGFGITVKADSLETAMHAAQNEPRKRNSFLQLHLNRWVNQATAWIPVEWWDACQADFPSGYEMLPACAGLDMAQKIDLASFVVTLRQPIEAPALKVEVAGQAEDGTEEKREVSLNFRVFSVPFFWLPEETVRDREREGFTAYRDWAEAGFLTITEGASIDYDRVYQDITKVIAPRFPLLRQGQIGYDPAFATDIAARLRDRGGFTTVEVLQNYKYFTEPCMVFEALVKEKRWMHDGHRLLRWCVENVAVKKDYAGRVRPVKPRKSAKKIDGVVAALMGLSRLMLQEEPQVNIYEQRMKEGGGELIDAW